MSGANKTSSIKPEQTFERTTLRTSRLLDFFSRKELIAQVGHSEESWPLVVVKELIDNSLDACEETRVAPQIEITVDESGITVADNGPGIPEESVAGICDYSVRVSSREAYIAPDRGAQGNALKTLIAMPFVLSGEIGTVTVTSRGKRHVITAEADRIAQVPAISIESEDAGDTVGTAVYISWPNDPSKRAESQRSRYEIEDSACGILCAAKSRFLQIASDFAFLNPHASITLSWHDEVTELKATDTSWSKWLPSNPTSCHWYQQEHFGRLIAGYIAHDRTSGTDRTVREFVSEFDGLSGSRKQKAVLDATGMAREPLSSLANCLDLDSGKVEALHRAMVDATKPVKPRRLGIIGKDHILARFAEIGAKVSESFKYAKKEGETDGVPWVVETAFAWCPEADSRRLVTGVNWSPGITNPFRELGRFGNSLDSILMDQRAGSDEPVALLLHIACPRVEYTDRGKSAVVTN